MCTSWEASWPWNSRGGNINAYKCNLFGRRRGSFLVVSCCFRHLNGPPAGSERSQNRTDGQNRPPNWIVLAIKSSIYFIYTHTHYTILFHYRYYTYISTVHSIHGLSCLRDRVYKFLFCSLFWEFVEKTVCTPFDSVPARLCLDWSRRSPTKGPSSPFPFDREDSTTVLPRTMLDLLIGFMRVSWCFSVLLIFIQ